jgi:hypothetical protein
MDSYVAEDFIIGAISAIQSPNISATFRAYHPMMFPLSNSSQTLLFWVFMAGIN